MPEPPHLHLALRHRLGSLTLDAAFHATAPWTVLFGPSGSGKSTLLRHLAGLARPDTGTIEVLNQTVCAPGIWLPPHRRPIRWAGQRAALFPRKTVKGNIAMGLGPAFPGRTWGDALDRALDLFNLREIENHYPAALSGGQRQRVSVIRAAIGAQHKLLLLDEPFAGLDAAVRDTLIAALRHWLGPATPILSVTHDIGEAFLLQAEVIRIAEGRVLAQGPAAHVLAAERHRLLATLATPESPAPAPASPQTVPRP